MTPSELKAHVEVTGGGRYFFTRETIQFFGDTMRNYGVRSAIVRDSSGDLQECWELYRRHPVKHGLQSSAYFSKYDYRRIFGEWVSK